MDRYGLSSPGDLWYVCLVLRREREVDMECAGLYTLFAGTSFDYRDGDCFFLPVCVDFMEAVKGLDKTVYYCKGRDCNGAD